MMWRKAAGVVCGLFLAAAVAGAEDLTFVAKRTAGDKPSETVTSYVTADKIRMSGSEGQEFIAEMASGRYTMIDHKKKEYSVMTRQELEAMQAQVQAQMKQAEQQMQNLPPQVRERMGKTMGSFAGSLKVEKGTGTRKVAGYTCQNWNMSMGEMFQQEQCVTSELAFPAAAWDAQKTFMGSIPGMGEAFQKIAEEMKKMNGIPIAGSSTVKMMGHVQRTTWETTEVKKGPIPASAWEPPAGYKKVESPLAKGLKK